MNADCLNDEEKVHCTTDDEIHRHRTCILSGLIYHL